MVRYDVSLVIPDGSIYFWMFTMGLKHVALDDIVEACARAGKNIRTKDVENYWNGWYRSDLYCQGEQSVFELSRKKLVKEPDFFDLKFSDYPKHPYFGNPEIQNRWVPCNKNNKPMIKWGAGCMTLADAKAYQHQVYLGENLKGCQFIVIDCDGDHDEMLDMETISFLYQFTRQTHTLSKPKRVCEYKGYENTGCELPASFHLTFAVDRVMPTRHFPYAHIDIVGNAENSLRYWKNKRWNMIQPLQMNDEIWEQLKQYIRHRKEAACLKE